MLIKKVRSDVAQKQKAVGRSEQGFGFRWARRVTAGVLSDRPTVTEFWVPIGVCQVVTAVRMDGLIFGDDVMINSFWIEVDESSLVQCSVRGRNLFVLVHRGAISKAQHPHGRII